VGIVFGLAQLVISICCKRQKLDIVHAKDLFKAFGIWFLLDLCPTEALS